MTVSRYQFKESSVVRIEAAMVEMPKLLIQHSVSMELAKSVTFATDVEVEGPRTILMSPVLSVLRATVGELSASSIKLLIGIIKAFGVPVVVDIRLMPERRQSRKHSSNVVQAISISRSMAASANTSLVYSRKRQEARKEAMRSLFSGMLQNLARSTGTF